MYAIDEGLKKINGTEVDTFRREVVDGHTCLEVEAGTTGYKGGCCRNAGGRTYIGIDCVTGDFCFQPITDDEGQAGRYRDRRLRRRRAERHYEGPGLLPGRPERPAVRSR